MPIDVTAGIKMLYVFVDISFDVGHLVASVQKNLSAYPRLALLSTIQFLTSLHVSLSTQLLSKALGIGKFNWKESAYFNLFSANVSFLSVGPMP